MAIGPRSSSRPTLRLVKINERSPLAFELASASATKEVRHPNTVLRLERVYIVTPDVQAVIQLYSEALGLAVPPIQRGTVIRADMAVFNVGPVGIAVATPFEERPAAQALQRQGPGLFQALFRVGSMARAASLITSNGLPEPLAAHATTANRPCWSVPTTRPGCTTHWSDLSYRATRLACSTSLRAPPPRQRFTMRGSGPVRST